MVKFGVFGACFCRFPYVFAVFLAGLWHSAPALTSGMLFRVFFQFGGVRQTMLIVCGVWGSSFASISDQSTPTTVFATPCAYWRVLFFWVELLPLSALKATTTQKIFAFFTFFGQEIASLLQVVAPLFEQGVSHEAVERCRERCLASNRPGIEGPAKPIHIGG